jgi:hypothetical protein
MAASSLVLVYGGPPLRVLGELGGAYALVLANRLGASSCALNLANMVAAALDEATRVGWGRVVLEADDLEALHDLLLSTAARDSRFDALCFEVAKALEA